MELNISTLDNRHDALLISRQHEAEYVEYDIEGLVRGYTGVGLGHPRKAHG